MRIQVSVGVHEESEERDLLERRRQALRTHTPSDDARSDRSRGWPEPEVQDAQAQGPAWAW